MRKKRQYILYTIWINLLLLISPPTYAAWDGALVGKEIRECMKDYHIPGVAVAIVKGEEVLLEKAFGKRRIDRPDSLTCQTVFWDVPGIREVLPYVMHQQKSLNLDAPIRPYIDQEDLSILFEDYLKNYLKIEDWILTLNTPDNAYKFGIWSERGGIKFGLTRHSIKLHKKILGQEQLALKQYLYTPLKMSFYEKIDSNSFMYFHRGHQENYVDDPPAKLYAEAPPKNVEYMLSLHDSIQLLKLYLGKKPAILTQALVAGLIV